MNACHVWGDIRRVWATEISLEPSWADCTLESQIAEQVTSHCALGDNWVREEGGSCSKETELRRLRGIWKEQYRLGLSFILFWKCFPKSQTLMLSSQTFFPRFFFCTFPSRSLTFLSLKADLRRFTSALEVQPAAPTRVLVARYGERAVGHVFPSPSA